MNRFLLHRASLACWPACFLFAHFPIQLQGEWCLVLAWGYLAGAIHARSCLHSVCLGLTWVDQLCLCFRGADTYAFSLQLWCGAPVH